MADEKSFLNGYKANFETIKRAAKNGRLALVECFDTRTNAKVAVLAAIGNSGEDYDIVPFAALFDNNPYEYLQPPNPYGGFSPIK